MTIKLNVIGDPIEHSKSPEVHGSILNILKIPYEYEKVKVKKNELDKYIENAIKNNNNKLQLLIKSLNYKVIDGNQEKKFIEKDFLNINTEKEYKELEEL